ncbi:flagellar biosynthesis regulator FlaF [Cohaesibacter haloalkalitolerans]|uniref:flagellar biosynthesis regulator FlaF n=1 Tax=Cohaesibacter haloalkalitolerans TaxID=1162980 RepID=UPI000E648C7D|nr:flagellar biosynthesis regulator FlaF [Cohaesibacter haloalkalitolerans]
MYTSYYAESSQLSGSCQRSQELQAINHVLESLREAKVMGIQSPQGVKALYETSTLWSFLLEDLIKPENAMPEQIKADLISLGIFILKEVGRVRLNQSDGIDTLIDLNAMISSGLTQ